MSKRGTMEHVRAIAKKKERVQDALDNLSTMTEDDIDALSNIPAWIKKELKKEVKVIIKREAGYLTPEEIADIMLKKSQEKT